jgi:hypothetical protein
MATLHSDKVEELMSLVNALSREALLEQFRIYRPTFPVDFTREFLDSQTIEQLRHLFLAMCLQSRRMPELPTAA